MLLAETFSCLIPRTGDVHSCLLMPYVGRDALNEDGTAEASAMSNGRSQRQCVFHMKNVHLFG